MRSVFAHVVHTIRRRIYTLLFVGIFFTGEVMKISPEWVPLLGVQCTSAVMGGITTTTLINPLDCIRARLQVTTNGLWTFSLCVYFSKSKKISCGIKSSQQIVVGISCLWNFCVLFTMPIQLVFLIFFQWSPHNWSEHNFTGRFFVINLFFRFHWVLWWRMVWLDNPFQVQRRDSFRQTFQILWQEEGMRMFTKGLSARVIMSTCYSFFIVLGYETVKRVSVRDEYRDRVRWWREKHHQFHVAPPLPIVQCRRRNKFTTDPTISTLASLCQNNAFQARQLKYFIRNNTCF